MQLAELIQRRESAWLDFKEKFHENNAKLLHDILCLTNAYHESDRYLVLGISDNGDVMGVRGDPNRKTNAQLQDFLRQSNFNRIPTCELETLAWKGLEVDILKIKNRPDKPFFLINDFVCGKARVRNGVTYTRLGDTNTPCNESAPDDHLELMWRERFGLGLSPLKRMQRLIDEPEAWKKRGDDYLYCEQFPEFTIVYGEILNEQFKESWTELLPDKSARSFEVLLRYHATVLDTVSFVACDGERYRVPTPETRCGADGQRKFFISKSSVGWKLAQIYEQYNPLDSALYGIQLEP